MNREYRKQYCYSLFKNYDQILTELELVYTLNHCGEKGREAEEILKSFLADYLPKRYAITTGFVSGSQGMSKQCDILLYDPLYIPPIFSGYVNKIINIITLRSVIECKMLLNGISSLEDANNKFKTIKELYRKDSLIQENLKKEPVTVFFVYKSSYKEDKFLCVLNKLQSKYIDIIFCADKGLYILDNQEYINYNRGYLCGITTDGYDASREKHGFALFYSYLIDELNKICCDYEKYLMVVDYLLSSEYIDYDK